MAQVLARASLVYLGTVNVGSAALFVYDKAQAVRGKWRVSERTLCQSAAIGGWAGGMVAMQLFRHKTRKKSFQEKYVNAMGQNFAGFGVAALLLTRSPRFRSAFSRDLKGTGRALVSLFNGGSRR